MNRPNGSTARSDGATGGLGTGRTTISTSIGTLALRDVGSGQPVVFLHGLLVDGHFWDRVTPLLPPVRMIIPDLPLGSHRRSMAASADLTPPGLARLVADLMNELDLREVILVGADFGGALAQFVALDHGERLGALVLSSCDAFDHFFPPTFWYLQALGYVPGALWLATQTLRLPGAHQLPLAFGRVQKRPVHAALARYWLSAARMDAGVRRDLGKVLRGVRRVYTQEAAERLPDFHRPTRLVWADTSKVFPIADGRRLAGLLPNATLVEVKDSYAHVALDAPAAVAHAVVDVLLPPASDQRQAATRSSGP